MIFISQQANKQQLSSSSSYFQQLHRSPMTRSRTPSSHLSDICSKDQDKFLPIANVSRIMKKSLPTNAKISKEAKETVQECVSEFISFVTGEAADKCQKEKRKTINGDDLLWAMTTLGFENYVGPLKVYLSKYRESEEEKNSMPRHDDHDDGGGEKLTAKPVFYSGNYHEDGQVLIGYSGDCFEFGSKFVGNERAATSLQHGVEW